MDSVLREEREKKRRRSDAQHRYYLKKKAALVKGDERKVTMNVRLPEYLVGLIHRMTMEALAKGTHPWKTTSETTRALLVLGIEALKIKDDNDVGDGDWAGIVLGEDLNRIASERRQAEMAAIRASEEIQRLLSIGSQDTAAQLYTRVMKNLHNLPPSTWRDWAMNKLEKNFPELHKTMITTGPKPSFKLNGYKKLIIAGKIS